MKIKSSELTGDALDWAVSELEHKGHFVADWHLYSTDWAQGGPVIEREQLNITSVGENYWRASTSKGLITSMYGRTPLIAAMRCYCASKLGNETTIDTEVEVPDELA